jgi:cytochrome c556
MTYLTNLKSALIAMAFAGLVINIAHGQVAPPPTPPSPPKPPFADPQDAIVARRAAFKAQGDIFNAMKKADDAGEDPKPFAADARWMVEWGKQIPVMFPKGSDTGHETKALPAIWTDKDTFDKDAAGFEDAITKLAALAEAGDKEGFVKQFGATGATCGTCHRAFRAR